MEFNGVKAFIFDLDDTLYPQKEYTRQCLMATTTFISEISGVNIQVVGNKLNSILDEKGIEYKYIFNDLFKGIGFDGMPYLKKILEIFWSCKPQLELFESTLDVLNNLKQNYKLALLTDGHEDVQQYKIDQLKIRDFFDEILITFSLGEEYRKPAILPYELMLQKLNIKACECIYVGNDPNRDFVACKKLKMKSLRINQGDYKDLFLGKNYDADFCIDNIKELLSLACNSA